MNGAQAPGTSTLAGYAKRKPRVRWMGVDRCAQCGVKLLEDEMGVTRWWAMGGLALCSRECVEAFKDAVRKGHVIGLEPRITTLEAYGVEV